MHQKGFPIIDYIDDYVGMGVPSVASAVGPQYQPEQACCPCNTSDVSGRSH